MLQNYYNNAVIMLTCMANPTISMPEELVEEIDRARAREAAETGNIQNRSQWLREAAREKLGVDYTDEQPDPQEAA
jgi:metal-responsive CopG/Arc/MetJ family transcriptional regulator